MSQPTTIDKGTITQLLTGWVSKNHHYFSKKICKSPMGTTELLVDAVMISMLKEFSEKGRVSVRNLFTIFSQTKDDKYPLQFVVRTKRRNQVSSCLGTFGELPKPPQCPDWLLLRVTKETGFQRNGVRLAIIEFFGLIALQLSFGDYVHIRGFGKFTIKTHKGYTANLVGLDGVKKVRTIAPATRVKFVVSQLFKQHRINFLKGNPDE